MLELLREPFSPTIGSPAAPIAPGPGTTLLLNLLSTLPLLLLLIKDYRDRSAVRHPIANTLFIATGLLAAASTLWATDRFAALITASTWLSAGFLAAAVCRLADTPATRRLVAAIALAAFSAQCAQGLSYVWVDLPALQESWQSQRTDFFTARGWQPDSFTARQFEKKVLGGELIGFTASANTYAANLLVGLLICTPLLILTIRQLRSSAKDPSAHEEHQVNLLRLLLLAALAATSLYLGLKTSSRTSGLAALLGLTAITAFLIASPRLVARLTANRRSLLVSAALLLAAAIAAVVALGISRDGDLLHPSLTFRWRYWLGGWHIFTQHLLTGVGFSNFGSEYLLVRLPQAAEEVRDPHNLLVRFAAELGLPGLLLLIAWLTDHWTHATRPIATPSETHPIVQPSLRIPAFGVAGSFLLVAICAIDFTSDTGYVIYEFARRLLFAGLMLMVALATCARSIRDFTIDPHGDQYTRLGILVATAMLLLVNLMDFSLAEPGTLSLAALLLGASLAGHRQPQPPALPPLHLPKLIATAALAAATTYLLFVVSSAERHARTGDSHLRANQTNLAAQSYFAAHKLLTLNYAYPLQLAQSMALAGGDPVQVRASTDLATRANPRSIESLSFRARYEFSQSNYPAAAHYQTLASALNPADTSLRIELAEYLIKANQSAQAAEELKRALWFDAQLDPTEPERLADTRKAELNALLDTLTSVNQPQH
jgi:O-antigen ligase